MTIKGAIKAGVAAANRIGTVGAVNAWADEIESRAAETFKARDYAGAEVLRAQATAARQTAARW